VQPAELLTEAPSKPTLAREKLPFTLQDVRSAIPSHCFIPSTAKSLSYFARDVAIVSGLYALAYYLDSWWFYPIFWLAQGTMFWALFVVGHDCGHGSFSRHKWLNNLIGHISHSFILVPFHGWRISHRTHHKNTGNIEKDESWYPVTENKYDEMQGWEKFLRFGIALLVVYPLYLFRRSPEREGGSHFHPNSPLFRPSESDNIVTSTIWWTQMVLMLAAGTYLWGGMWLVKFYLMPYIIFVIWLDLVTFLHHTDDDIPWYRGQDWYFLKGALSTIDYDYGFINKIHHDIGTHVVHHIFLSIPHYHLEEATEAVKPVLGEYYRKANRSLWASFWDAYNNCHFVANEGSKIYYQSK
jgi:omega-3 fatty acid desaturase (delta-15 desaturase)